MTSRRSLLIAATVVLVALIGGGILAKQLIFSGAAVTTSSGKPSPPTARERTLLKLINAQRAKYGRKPLVYDAVMAKVARAHNDDMIDRGYFSHDDPSGHPTFAERVHSVLVLPGRNAIGENIAEGSGPYGTPSGLVTAWMNSPGHRANILNPTYHRTGFGASLAKRYLGFPNVVVATEDFSN